MKLENDWNEAEKALFDMYNENHGCMFGLDLGQRGGDSSSTIEIRVPYREIPVQISDTVSQHEIQ